MPPPEPTASQLGALAEKYQLLLQLRTARDGADEPTADRRTLRDLSRRYPRCLRELDILGEAELRRRAEVARAAAVSEGPREPWMGWILRFHTLLAESLAEKAAGHRAPRIPGGRITPLILSKVAAEFAVPVEHVTWTLFPSRRPRDEDLD